MAVESRVPQTKIDGGDNENKCFLPRTEPLLPLHPLFLPPHTQNPAVLRRTLTWCKPKSAHMDKVLHVDVTRWSTPKSE